MQTGLEKDFVLLLGAIVAPVFSAGAAYAGVKTALNGMRADVAMIRQDTQRLVGSDAVQNERLARLEVAGQSRSERLERIEKAVDLQTKR